MGLSGARKQGSGEDYITRSFMVCTPRQYYSSYKIKKYVLGVACAHVGDRTGAYKFWWGNVTERENFDLRQLDILYMGLDVSGNKTRANEVKRR